MNNSERAITDKAFQFGMSEDTFYAFYGRFVCRSEYCYEWEHNPLLTKTEEEQLEHNMKYHKDFKVLKYIPPLL